MVKVKRGYVLGAAVCSVVAVALSLASIATDNWIHADLKPESEVFSTSHVHYGLWNGVYTQVLGSDSTAFVITMTCLYDLNACAVLCRDTTEQREDELQDLVDKKDVPNLRCNFVVRKAYGTKVLNSTPRNTRGSSKRSFINAGFYLTTIIFLTLSIAFGLFSSGLLIWNVVGNPIQTLFSIYSLYYYLVAAAVTVLIAIIVWGALFASTIIENVAILVTLNGQMRNNQNAVLDYSYWLNLGSLVLYFVSFGLLLTRKFQMDDENIIMRNINQGNQVIF